MSATTAIRKAPSVGFATEAQLVDEFLLALDAMSPWGNLQTTTEWDYRTGITDVLVRNVEGHIIAFEAKLRDWRRAVHQAYRNTVFARSAYVVLPYLTAAKAFACPEVFAQYGVGLCSFENKCIRILIEAPPNEALIPWLRVRAQDFFDRSERREVAPTLNG